MKNLMLILKGKKPLSDVYHYLLGNYRLWLWNNYRSGIRLHIIAQIYYRIRTMNPLCYDNGECIMCHCATLALQMSNKKCKGNCYPRMLNKREFKTFSTQGIIVEDLFMVWVYIDNRYILHKKTNDGLQPVTHVPTTV